MSKIKSFNELKDRPKNFYPFVKTPSPVPQPIPITSPNSNLMTSSSPLNFSVPKQSEWGFIANRNVNTTNDIELDCCLGIANGKLEKSFQELGISYQKVDGKYECQYKFFEEEEVSVYFDIVIEEGKESEMTQSFGDRTMIKFLYAKGDVVSFTDVCELITRLVIDKDY